MGVVCGFDGGKQQRAARSRAVGEAFPTEDAAWDDARKALKELRGPSRPDG